jgi:limonene-1,2-epoxide hydrolase
LLHYKYIKPGAVPSTVSWHALFCRKSPDLILLNMANTAPRQTVLSFLKAMNAEDYVTARKFTETTLSFVGVLGTREGADAYFKDMEKMKLKYDVQQVFVEGDDVCVIYDITMAGTKAFSCGLYHVNTGKITSIRVIFDPRPILELNKKK